MSAENKEEGDKVLKTWTNLANYIIKQRASEINRKIEEVLLKWEPEIKIDRSYLEENVGEERD